MAARDEQFDDDELATPHSQRRRWWQLRAPNRRSRGDADASDRAERPDSDRVGRLMEAFARGMGTPSFLIALTIFCAVWLTWNSMAPEAARFDSAALGFTALTLMLSLQASYAAPMLLLAQNRQDDRDRVQIEQDRQRAERNTADLEYLARELVALRMLVSDMASKDFIRAELRGLLQDLEELEDDEDDDESDAAERAAVRRARAAEGDEYRERDASEQRRRAKARRDAEAAEADESHE